MALNNKISSIVQYIKDDYQSNHLRFFMECTSWLCSIVSSIMFAITVPNIPVIPLYMVFLTGCSAAVWTCWTRGSFGMMMNYLFIIAIDIAGLIKIWTQSVA